MLSFAIIGGIMVDDRIKMNHTESDNGAVQNNAPDKDAVYGGLRCRLDYDNYLNELKNKKNSNDAGIKKGIAFTFAVVGILALLSVIGLLIFNANAAESVNCDYDSGEYNSLVYSDANQY